MPYIYCSDWNAAMCHLIRTGKWDQVEKKPACPMDCLSCMYSKTPLTLFLSDQYPLTAESETLIHQMYGGEFTPKRWFDYFLYHPPSVSALRYLIQEGRISSDHSDPYTLLGRSFVYYSQAHIDFLLDEVGAHVNLPNTNGSTALLSYLRVVWDDEEAVEDRPEEGSDVWTSAIQRLECLLQRGADPLLENKEGVSPLSYAEALTSFSAAQKEALLAVLRRYV